MSTGQILTVVGYAVGTYFGYPQLGAVVGGIVGSQIDAANVSFDVPKVGDLKAPQMQYGGKLVRLYGSNRTSTTLAWYSDKRVIAGDDGGKGEPDAPTADTAEIDVLYLFSVDSPVIAIVRVWKNGEVIWTARADSDSESLVESLRTDAWESMDFLDGNPAQMPHPTIEASDGVGNVSAYRHRQGAMITGLQLGQSGQMPLIEFEVITKGASEFRQLDGLLCHFDELEGADVLSAIGPNMVRSGTAALDTGSPHFGDAAGEIGGTGHFTATGCTGDLTDKSWRLQFFVRLNTYGGDLFTITNVATTASYTLVASAITEAFIFSLTTNIGSGGGALGDPDRAISLGFYNHVVLQYSAVTGRLSVLANGALVGDNGTGDFYGGKTFETVVIGAGADGRFDEVFLETDVAPDELYPDTYAVPDAPFEGGPQPTAWTIEAEDWSDIMAAEWARVSDPARIDVSDLIGIPCRGFQTAGSVRGAMEAAAQVVHFGAVCSDKLYLRLMGAAPKATLAFSELGAGEDKPADEPFAPERANEEEIVERVTLTFPDYSNDYNAGTQSGNRGTGTSSIVQASQTNVVMTPSEAKAVAEIAAALAGIGATSGQITLTDYHADKEPTDCLIVPDEDGNLHRVRLMRDTYGGGVHVFDWVLDDPNALVAVGITSGAGGQALTVLPPAETEIVLMDTAIFRDVDDDPGFYAFAKGSSRGSRLFDSADGVTYAEAAVFTAQSVFGNCTTTLGDWTGGWLFDETNSVTVNVGSGTLSSSTRAGLIADQAVNACAIGIDGRWELCQFRNAALVSPGVYTLSGFLRGLRGSEQLSVDHAPGEKFVLITTAARRIERQASEIGVAEFYKGVSAGRLLSSATAVEFVDNAVGLKPFAPVHLRKSVGASETVVSWTPRTRHATRFASPLGIYAPMSEATESYDVELRDASDVLVSTDTVTEPEWSAANAQVTGNLASAANFLHFIGGDIIGVSGIETSNNFVDVHLKRFNSSGVLIDESPAFGSYAYQTAVNGDVIYVAVGYFNAGPPTTFLGTAIHRLTRTALGTTLAYTAPPLSGDLQGVAFDGTDLWATEYYSGNLRKLDATSMTSIATYVVETGMANLVHHAGSLYIASSSTDEVIEWDIATQTEVRRIAVVDYPTYLLIDSGTLFVGGNALGVYDLATGSLKSTFATVDSRHMAMFGGFLAVTNQLQPQAVLLIDPATGLEDRRIDTRNFGSDLLAHTFDIAYPAIYSTYAGGDGTTMYVTKNASGVTTQTFSFELLAADLSGYSVAVYQNSAVVGRGYPATLEL